MYVYWLVVAALFSSAFISAILAWLAWRRKDTRGNVFFSALMLSLALYSTTVALELLSPGLKAKVLWSKAQYLGNAHLAVLWFLFIAKYGSFDFRLTPRRLAVLWAVPVLSILLVATNEWHGLAWPDIRIVPGGMAGMAVYEHGAAVWLLAAYSYILMCASTLILLKVAWRGPWVYQGQAAILLVAALLPWLGNVMYMARIGPFHGFDMAPIFFAVSGGVLGWGTFHFRLFRMTPVAHAAILSHMSEGLLILDDEGTILDMNPAAERLLAAPRSPAGTSIASACPGAAILATQGEGAVTLEWKATDGNSDTQWIEAVVNALPRAAHRSTCRLVFLRDITEKKALTAQLLQAQKMESVGRLAGGVAHDFNNTLAAIICYTELALSQLDAESPIRSDLHEIEKAAHRSAELTQQLLAFGRKQIITPRVVNVEEIVSSSAKMLSRLVGAQRTLDMRIEDTLWTVRIDPVQLDQILANLVVNAKDAIPGAGSITVRLNNVELGKVDCRRRPDARPGRFVCLSVSDSGSGMSENVMERIFEPFFTTKSSGQGTGLGLSTVYGIVKQNHGFIEVSSHIGVGSTFSVYFPTYQEGAVAARTPVKRPLVSSRA